MATWIWALISVVIVLILLWAFYNFYWLNQSQIYLVYSTTTGTANVPFNQVDLTKLRTAFGAQWATVAQLNDVGAAVCNGGWADEGTNPPTNIYYPMWRQQDSCISVICKNGCITGCGCNNQVNKFGPGQIISQGYWLYGTKPALNATTLIPTGWAIAAWSDLKYNKYEILGIPKII